MRRIVFLITIIFPLQLFAQGTWKRMADYPINDQKKNDLINSFVVNNKLYVMHLKKDANDTEVWEYNPALNLWTQKSNFPGPPQESPFCLGINNKGYYGLGNWPNPIGFWDYEPSTDNWTQKAIPSEVIVGSSSFSLHGKGYFAMNSNSIMVFNPDSNKWSVATFYPTTPMHNAFVFTVGEKAYIGGGFKNQWNYSEFFSYSPLINEWKKKNNLPTLYFTNGFSICQFGYGISLNNDFFYRYNVETDTWNILGKRPKMSPAVSHRIGKKGYIGLGKDSLGNPSNIFWEFTPEDSCTQFSGLEKAKTIEFSLNPNPLSTESYLQISNPTNEPFTFNLYQSNGKLVQTETGQANEPLKITREGLENGIYFFQITQGSKQAFGKLILQ